jgi:hypothetical protein
MKKLLSLFLSIISIVTLSIQANAQLPGSGNAYDFTSSYITAPNHASLNSGVITLEAWIKADSWGTNIWENVIISKDGWALGEQGYTLRSGANGSLSFNIGTPGAWYEVASGPLMSVGQWYHVAGSYDGTTMRLYINGEEINTTAITGSIASGTYDLNIGKIAYTAGGFRYFDGKIDEVRVWTTAVPQSAIQAYMCKKVTAVHPNYASLGGYWNFDDVGTVLDNSANTNNGAIFGTTQVLSGAAIGDESMYSYSTPFDMTLGIPGVDSVQVESSSAAQTIHLYRVDMPPTNVTTDLTIDSMDYSHYYGVYVGSSLPYTYDLSYHYSTHPLSVGNEANLELAGRVDGTISPWTAQFATVNIPVDEVEQTFSNRIEVMLGISCTQINLDASGAISVCQGDTITAMDLASNANYQWHDGSGPIVGETSNMIDLTYTEDFYLVANSGACTDTSATINLLVFPTPIVDFGTAPNPEVCENDADFPLTGSSPAGGAYTGTGVVGTTFSPSTAGPGTYWITYTYVDGNSCMASDSMEFTVYPQPSTPIITTVGETMCVSSGGIGTVYNWELNGTQVASSTDTCYTALANGSYTVVCVSADGCISDEAVETFDYIGIGVMNMSSKISAVPNPTEGIVNVTVSKEWTENATINILDTKGRVLLSKKLSDGTVQLDLSMYDSGVYFLRIEANGEHFIKRVVRK